MGPTSPPLAPFPVHHLVYVTKLLLSTLPVLPGMHVYIALVLCLWSADQWDLRWPPCILMRAAADLVRLKGAHVKTPGYGPGCKGRVVVLSRRRVHRKMCRFTPAAKQGDLLSELESLQVGGWLQALSTAGRLASRLIFVSRAAVFRALTLGRCIFCQC